VQTASQAHTRTREKPNEKKHAKKRYFFDVCKTIPDNGETEDSHKAPRHGIGVGETVCSLFLHTRPRTGRKKGARKESINQKENKMHRDITFVISCKRKQFKEGI
jgi:ribulose kinase